MAVPLADALGATAGEWSFSSGLKLAAPSVTLSKTLLKRVPFMAALLVCLILLFYPLGPLFTYYQENMESGNSNQLLLNIVVELRQAQDSDIPIYLDHELKHIRHAVNSIASKALAYLLTLDGTRFEVIKLSETETSPVTSKYGWWDYPSQVIRPSNPLMPSEAMLVLTWQSYLTLQQVFELSPIIAIESEVPHSQGSYGLYRLEGRR
jgi:hypothetical protein